MEPFHRISVEERHLRSVYALLTTQLTAEHITFYELIYFVFTHKQLHISSGVNLSVCFLFLFVNASPPCLSVSCSKTHVCAEWKGYIVFCLVSHCENAWLRCWLKYKSVDVLGEVAYSQALRGGECELLQATVDTSHTDTQPLRRGHTSAHSKRKQHKCPGEWAVLLTRCVCPPRETN